MRIFQIAHALSIIGEQLGVAVEPCVRVQNIALVRLNRFCVHLVDWYEQLPFQRKRELIVQVWGRGFGPLGTQERVHVEAEYLLIAWRFLAQAFSQLFQIRRRVRFQEALRNSLVHLSQKWILIMFISSFTNEISFFFNFSKSKFIFLKIIRDLWSIKLLGEFKFDAKLDDFVHRIVQTILNSTWIDFLDDFIF